MTNYTHNIIMLTSRCFTCFRSPSTHKMSPLCRKIFLNFMPKLMCMRRTHYSLPDYDDTTPSQGYTNEIEVRYVRHKFLRIQLSLLDYIEHYTHKSKYLLVTIFTYSTVIASPMTSRMTIKLTDKMETLTILDPMFHNLVNN